MSATFPSPVSPVDCRDIRSASQPFKRDKDHDSKWSNGQRPSAGCKIRWTPEEHEHLYGGSESQKEKVRPRKQNSQTYGGSKSHANRTPKLGDANSWDLGRSSNRVARTADAHFESHDSPLSRSLLELLPQHTNNEQPAVATAIYHDGLDSVYSSVVNPAEGPQTVGLEGLVEKAEKKWVSEQTDKIVRGEYEVLDGEGETTVLKKGKRSPKQKTVKNEPVVAKAIEDDDEFELI